MHLSSTQKFLLFFIPYFLLFCLTSHYALFWDTVQFGADHPNWYYSTHFKHLLLPDFCDSGHIPGFGIYIASVWELFGRGLFQSHAAMLPFVALIVWQSIRLGDILFPNENKQATALSFVLLTQCVLITQCILVSPDVLLVGFFLWALNAILSGRKTQLMLAILALALVSNRGIMLSLALYCFALFYDIRNNSIPVNKWAHQAFKTVSYFLPAAMIALAFFGYHYHVKGWVAAPVHSEWKKSFSMDPLSRMPLNIAILGWRIVELGNIVTVLVCCVTLFLWFRKKIEFKSQRDKVIAQALMILIVAVFFFTAFSLIFNFRLLAQRYLMPLNLCVGMMAVFLLFHSDIKRKNLWIELMVLVQLSGHFWTYPQRMSQGWEGTLSHVYYYPLRQDFMEYMKLNNIRKEDVATAGCMTQSEYRTDLLTDTVNFKDTESDTAKYVWYCNVANALNKSLPYYKEHFIIVKEEKRGYVDMILFKRPDVESVEIRK